MPQPRRILLRRVEASDHEDIQRWQNDPEVHRWMDYEHPFSLDDIHRSEERAREEGYPFIVEVDGKTIGRVGLNNLRWRDRMASLYIFLGERDHWGKGFGLETIEAILEFGFERLNLRKIELWTLADNDRAIRLYKRVGFQEDARLPARSFKDGEYVDHLVLSIDRDVFRAR